MSIQEEKKELLCNLCSSFGYCLSYAKRKKLDEFFEKHRANQLRRLSPLSNREITQIVPLRTDSRIAYTNLGKKLQQAHELFHQEEFEQASYLYLDMLETRNDCDEIKIGLAGCFYFLEKYEAAALMAQKLSDQFPHEFSVRMMVTCESKLTEREVAFNPSATSLNNNSHSSTRRTSCCKQN